MISVDDLCFLWINTANMADIFDSVLHRWLRIPQGMDKTTSIPIYLKKSSAVCLGCNSLTCEHRRPASCGSWVGHRPLRCIGGCLDEVACICSRDFGPLADHSDREHTKVMNGYWSREFSPVTGRINLLRDTDVLLLGSISPWRAQSTSVCLLNTMAPTLVRIQRCCHVHSSICTSLRLQFLVASAFLGHCRSSWLNSLPPYLV